MPTIQKTIRMYEFIKGYIASNHEPPTIKEIGQQFGMRSPASVFQHLMKMEAEGWIKRVPNINRGIRLIDQEQDKAA